MLRASIAAGIAVLPLFALMASTAGATAQRTFVSVTGVDTNACSVTAPCRSFAAALAQATAGGEIIVVDSGGYGPVVINKPVSIAAPSGVYAGVSVFSGTGISVNPGSGVVTLTGLTINGVGGAIGIQFLSGDNLTLNNIIVSGMTASGVYGRVPGSVSINDSAFLNNGTVINDGGINLSTSSGTLAVNVARSRFDGNYTGMFLLDNVKGVVEDSIVRRSIYAAGYIQTGTVGAPTRVTIQRCTVSANLYGLFFGFLSGDPTVVEVTDSELSDNVGSAVYMETQGTAYFSNTKITRNGAGIDISTFGGTAISFKDNLVYSNGGMEVFSSTLLKK